MEGRDDKVRARAYIYVDESQVGREQAALYREDLGIWMMGRQMPPPVYINEDATGGGLELMLAMARRATAVTLAIPAVADLRGRFADVVKVGDLYAPAQGMWWPRGASEYCEYRQISDAIQLRTLAPPQRNGRDLCPAPQFRGES